ncbi:hypothetical protein BpHYR1_014521 [Brachionus plicatilis]|uniref:Uncharacterized protein n=1 Tax=Brachionus plicatilis TaxID=10195 RepID=A0A3M7SG15_BRAPC|nr:hypothetical protein BpHYR1_014521 [Brachionus plicatilis]
MNHTDLIISFFSFYKVTFPDNITTLSFQFSENNYSKHACGDFLLERHLCTIIDLQQFFEPDKAVLMVRSDKKFELNRYIDYYDMNVDESEFCNMFDLIILGIKNLLTFNLPILVNELAHTH